MSFHSPPLSSLKSINRGVSLYIIGEFFERRDGRVTCRYAHLSPDARRDAVLLLDGHGTQVAPEVGVVTRYNQKS